MTEAMKSDLTVAISSGAETIQTVNLEGERLAVVLMRRPDGKAVVVISSDDDGEPPNQLLMRGGDGYPGAKLFVWKKIDIAEPPEKAGRRWRLIRAIGWDPDA